MCKSPLQLIVTETYTSASETWVESLCMLWIHVSGGGISSLFLNLGTSCRRIGNLFDFTQKIRTAHKAYEHSYKNVKSNVYENMQCSNQDVPDSTGTALAFSGIWLRYIINILYYGIDNVFSWMFPFVDCKSGNGFSDLQSRFSPS
jgi:hypothetical protein